jgi:hypothetical protein
LVASYRRQVLELLVALKVETTNQIFRTPITPQQGIVGIPYLDAYVERAALDYLDRNAR